MISLAATPYSFEQTDRQTDRQTDIHTDRQKDRQTNKHTDKQTKKPSKTSITRPYALRDLRFDHSDRETYAVSKRKTMLRFATPPFYVLSLIKERIPRRLTNRIYRNKRPRLAGV